MQRREKQRESRRQQPPRFMFPSFSESQETLQWHPQRHHAQEFCRDHEQLKDTQFSISSRQLQDDPRKDCVTPLQECGPTLPRRSVRACAAAVSWTILSKSLYMVSWPWDLLDIPGCGHRPLTMTQQEISGMSVPLYLELPHRYSVGSLHWKKSFHCSTAQGPNILPSWGPRKESSLGISICFHCRYRCFQPFPSPGQVRRQEVSVHADLPWEPSPWH